MTHDRRELAMVGDRILAAFRAGRNTAEIAEQVGASESLVEMALHEAKERERSRGGVAPPAEPG